LRLNYSIYIYPPLGFVGKNETVMIEYLEKHGWDHSVYTTSDSIIQWQYPLADNSFLTLNYYLGKPGGKIYTIDLDLLESEFLNILNNSAAYGLKKAGIRRKGSDIYNDFTKGDIRVALCQSPQGGGNHYSLIVYDFNSQ
jgi:hypothetical protein